MITFYKIRWMQKKSIGRFAISSLLHSVLALHAETEAMVATFNSVVYAPWLKKHVRLT
jgi:hypothetical protein